MLDNVYNLVHPAVAKKILHIFKKAAKLSL